MGSLANCIKIHGISKEEAKLLRKTAMLYRQGGMKAKLANEQAVKDTLDDLTSERDSINRQIQDVLARRKPERAEFRQRIQGLIDTGQMTNEELKTIRNERLLEKLGVVSKEKPDRRVDLEKREEVKKWMRLENLSPEDEYTRERLKAVWEQIRTEKAGETKDISQVVGEVRKPAVDQKLLQKEIEPTTYVHETNATTFDKFDMAKIGTGQGDAWLGQGIYLQEKGSFKLETYGKNKIEASLAPDAKIFEVKNTPDGEYRDTFVEYAVNNGIGRAKELVDQRRKDGLSLKNLLPRDILRNNPEAVEQLKKAGFDGLLQDGELVVYNPDILKITTQKGAYPVKNKPISELIIDLNDAIGDKGAIGGEGGADVSKVVPILMDIGKTVYADGHQTYVAFKRQMQVTLGKTYQKVRDLILKVWEMVKRYAKEVQPGLSIRDVSKEGKAPIFFSQLQQLIEQKMPNKADVQTVRNIIRDAKQDEIKWSGIEDFLQGKDTVNKQELLDYLRANEIEIKEVTLSDKSQYSGRTPEDLLEEADEAERIAQKAQKQGDNEKAERYFQKSDELSRAAEGLDLESGTVKGMPRFAQYQTPGGKNYRELLLTLPIKSEAPVSFDNWVVKQPWYNTWVSEGSDFNKAKDVFNEWLKRENYGRGFTGFHFDEPNVLAHVRMNDRVDTEGNKVLFLEEIQSDWHQEGRKKGYKLDAKQEKHYRELADRFDDPQQRNPLTESEKEELKQLISIESSVPPAPFSKTWHELALKRMLRYASENGYDKVAWTTGEMQAERYDLSKQIDSLEYIKNEDGTYEVTAHKEGTLLDMPSEWDHIKPEDLDKYVGKDVAQKIIGDKGKLDNKGYKELSGVDLKVGGEGMKGFYDKIIPDFLNKYGKKWGARVREIKVGKEAQFEDKNLPNDWQITKPKTFITVPSIDITPPMKTEVLTKGQALYSGIPIPEMVKALKDLHNLGKKTEAYSKLVDISNQVYADGATTLNDFTAKMKSTLGDLWEKFKHLINELYSKAKAFNEQLGERGSISTKKTIREATGQAKPSDMVREDAALTAGLAKVARAAQTAFRAGNKEGYAEAKVQLTNILNRTKKLRAVRDYFGLTDSELKQISGKNPLLMSQYEFKLYIDEVRQKALELVENSFEKARIMQNILDKNLKKVNNYRMALDLPPITKMTTEQAKQFADLLEPFQEDDVFLTTRELETVDRTDLAGIRTWREAKERLAKETGVPVEELEKIHITEFDKYRWDTSLAEKNPFYKMVVTETTRNLLEGNMRYHDIENKVFELARKSEKSRSRTLIEKAIPQDKQILEYLEAPVESKETLAREMTPEQLDLAHYIQTYFGNALEYLIKENALGKGRENYFVHVRRSFLENAKEEGLVTAVKDLFKNYQEDLAVFQILDKDTGKILPLEKFFQFSLHRSGVLKPSANIVKAFLTYARTFEKKVSLDEIIPKIDIYAQSLTPQKLTPRGLEKDRSIKTFVNEYINNKKGRRIDQMVGKQGGIIDVSIRGLRTFTTLLDLGFNIPVGLATYVGESVVNFIELGVKKAALGTIRVRTDKGKRIIKKYEAWVGRSVWENFTAPGKELPERLAEGMFGLFHQSMVDANRHFLLGSLTEEEYKNEVIDNQRLAELKIEMGRWRVVPDSKSLVGSTAVGSAAMQYKSWAAPIIRTTAKDINTLIRDLKNKPSNEALTTKEAKELYRIIGITSTVLIAYTMIIADEDEEDKTFIGELIRKAFREAMTLLQGVDPKLWLATPRVIGFLTKLGENLHALFTLEEYKTKEGYKGVEGLEKQFTPRAVKQFQSKEKD